MVVGDMSSFSLPPKFRRDGSRSSSDSSTGGVKSFINGVMSPFTACLQPDIASCAPGCGTGYHNRRYQKQPSPALVSPYLDRLNARNHYEASSPQTPDSPQYQTRNSAVRSNAEPVPEQSQQASEIDQPHSNDVLCGRGGSSNRHLGNMHFRELVAANKKMYVGLTKKQKMLVARKIVEMVHNTSPPGRFLAKDLDSGLWYDIGLPRSLEKTSQALREKNSNDYPVHQDNASEVLSDASGPPSPRSESGVSSPIGNDEDRLGSKGSRNGKTVEAPPLIIPNSLMKVFAPDRLQEHGQSWPEHQGGRQLEQPFLNPYQRPPPGSSPHADHYGPPPPHSGAPYDEPPPRSPPHHYGRPRPYPRAEPPLPYRPSSVGHVDSPTSPPPDYREHYDYRYPDPRDHYGQMSPPGPSSHSGRLPPPPPHGHYRGPPPPRPPGPPPRHHPYRAQRHSHPPPLHPRPMHYHPDAPAPQYERPLAHHHPYGPPRTSSAEPQQAPTSPASPPHPPATIGSGYVRGKSEVSPERRQEWKRQRNEHGIPRRLNSDSSLSHAVAKSLTLEERVVGRERASSNSRDLCSPSGTLQGRSRPRAVKLSATSASEPSPSLDEKEGDAVSALSGLAALSTAAFLKLDETD